MLDITIFDKESEFQGVKGLIFLEDKIVVFRRDDKTKNFPLMVDLPGGEREENESPFETFTREVKEEFGLSIIEEDIIYSKKYPSIIDSNMFAYFLVAKPQTIQESDIIFGDEGLYYLLMTPEEYAGLPDGIKKQQEKVIEFLEISKV